MSSNNANGCFGVIAIILAIFGGLLLLGQGCKKLGEEIKDDPGNVIGIVFLIAAGAAILYFITKEPKD